MILPILLSGALASVVTYAGVAAFRRWAESRRIDPSDTQVGTATLSDPADLSIGSHTKPFTIGSGPGEIALPGAGLVETNGHQNYRNWEAMRRHHPCFGAPWTLPEKGVFRLDSDFHARSGGLFERSSHYEAMFRRS